MVFVDRHSRYRYLQLLPGGPAEHGRAKLRVHRDDIIRLRHRRRSQRGELLRGEDGVVFPDEITGARIRKPRHPGQCDRPGTHRYAVASRRPDARRIRQCPQRLRKPAADKAARAAGGSRGCGGFSAERPRKFYYWPADSTQWRPGDVVKAASPLRLIRARKAIILAIHRSDMKSIPTNRI